MSKQDIYVWNISIKFAFSINFQLQKCKRVLGKLEGILQKELSTNKYIHGISSSAMKTKS